MSPTADSKLTLTFESDSRCFDAWASRLESARDRWVACEGVDRDSKSQFTARIPHGLSFFQLPEWQLLSYEQHREASDLGDVFRIANGLHDWIDALVVLGNSRLIDGIEAVFRVCCDPFHNELNRAARGSKPRVYFADETGDNDRVHSLVSRIAQGGYGDGHAEDRCAAIVLGEDPRIGATLHVLNDLGQLKRRPNARAPELLTLIARHGRESAHAIDHETLFVPSGLSDPEMILSIGGLLPAAFLGLDCIQLLVGAANVNEHFSVEPYANNLVLQFIAARLEAMTKLSVDATTNQSSLRPLVRWFSDGLSLQSVPPGSSSCANEPPCLTYMARNPRTDQIRGVTATSEPSAGNRLILPTIDFRPLGEWIQLELICQRLIREIASESGSNVSSRLEDTEKSA